MFDNYSRNSYNNPQTVNINAVSGTIVKNYKDSFILRCHMKSELAEALLAKEPQLIKRIVEHPGTYSSWKEKIKEPVVVLQVMLCGEQELLAEVMWKEDFDKMLQPQVESKRDLLDKLRAALHATAEMHEDGDYYLRDEWIDEYFDKYIAENEEQHAANN